MSGIFTVFLSTMMAVSLSACGTAQDTAPQPPAESTVISTEDTGTSTQSSSGAPAESETAASTTSPEQEDGTNTEVGSNILIAYFSQTGNTESIAGMIADETGGELFHLQTVETYPTDHMELISVAQEEQDANARPELTADVENFDDYDTVFIGYPNWWADMPMAVYTFLEAHDWEGKTVIPFCTHGGSGLSRTERSIAEICTGAEVLEGLAVRDTKIDGAGADVKAWLQGLGC